LLRELSSFLAPFAVQSTLIALFFTDRTAKAAKECRKNAETDEIRTLLDKEAADKSMLPITPPRLC